MNKLKRFMKKLKGFKKDNKGQALIEYALIITVISITVIGGLSNLGDKVSNTFENVFEDPVPDEVSLTHSHLYLYNDNTHGNDDINKKGYEHLYVKTPLIKSVEYNDINIYQFKYKYIDKHDPNINSKIYKGYDSIPKFADLFGTSNSRVIVTFEDNTTKQYDKVAGGFNVRSIDLDDPNLSIRDEAKNEDFFNIMSSEFDFNLESYLIISDKPIKNLEIVELVYSNV